MMTQWCLQNETGEETKRTGTHHQCSWSLLLCSSLYLFPLVHVESLDKSQRLPWNILDLWTDSTLYRITKLYALCGGFALWHWSHFICNCYLFWISIKIFIKRKRGKYIVYLGTIQKSLWDKMSYQVSLLYNSSSASHFLLLTGEVRSK